MRRIAVHRRDPRRNGYSTKEEHMPESHLRYKQSKSWDADYFNGIAQTFQQLIKEPVNQKIKEFITFQKRMVKYSDYVFAFLDDLHIPPDNNASERTIRNFKMKLIISNFFKSTAGSDSYAVIRSIIDTAIKNQQNHYEATRLIAILPKTG